VLAEQRRDVAHDARGASEALEIFGAGRSAAVGNGANDAEMLAAAALGIAVIGPEGASTAALMAADLVCGSVTDALDLLADPPCPHGNTAPLAWSRWRGRWRSVGAGGGCRVGALVG